jgi:hypothetical protein
LTALSDVREHFAEKIQKEHLGALVDRLNRFIDILKRKGFLCWESEEIEEGQS